MKGIIDKIIGIFLDIFDKMREMAEAIYERLPSFLQNKWMIGAISLIGLMLLLLLFSAFLSLFNAAEKTQVPIEPTHKTEEQKKDLSKVEKLNNMTILIVGTDKPDIPATVSTEEGQGEEDTTETEYEPVRTDSMVLVTYNAEKNTAKTFRIPRDLYVNDLSEDGYEGKLNGVYRQEGMTGLLQNVEKYTGVPVTNYIRTDYAGLEKIVDAIGGIEINSKIELKDSATMKVGKGIVIEKGLQTLDGRSALAYSRVRSIDNDIKRGERQQEVIRAIMRKMASTENIVNLPSTIEVVSDYIQTDMPLSDITRRYMASGGNTSIEPVHFEWADVMVNQQDYVYLKPGERERVSRELREHLGINPESGLEEYNENPAESN